MIPRRLLPTFTSALRHLELAPLDASEVGRKRLDALWLRGGFPESLLAASIPQLGRRIPAETLRRFWTMLAHQQGGLLNAAALARALGVDGKTVAAYLVLLVDLLLVRRLSPWHGNVRNRLVKSPKVYVRDSGLVHALPAIDEREPSSWPEASSPQSAWRP